MSKPDEVDLEGLHRLAEQFAVMVRPGDCLALSGELGAGKTTFARAFIASLLGEEGEIPSPSFSLVQRYETPRMPVSHFDFYRLGGSEEVEELGLEEALEDGIALVEWPEKAGPFLPPSHLRIRLMDGQTPQTRRLEIEGHGQWVPRLKRLMAINGFLARSGFQAARRAYLQGDASARAYVRLRVDGGEKANGASGASAPVARAVLMDAPRQPDGPPIRDGKPYSAIAHLAEDVRPFVAVARALKRIGLSVPEIHAADLEQGLLVIEDFGHAVFGQKVAQGADISRLWRAAVDVLLHLRGHVPPGHLGLDDGSTVPLKTYDAGAMGIEVALLPDWYWPALYGADIPDRVRADFAEIWQGHFNALLAEPQNAWVLRDFHSPNLMWLEARTGIRRVGLLDFQDALRGHAAYDLVSLLQDARLDVAADIEQELLAYYCEKARKQDRDFDEKAFRAAYARLGAQRNTKILGIFARLARRDQKPHYLHHIPRILTYLERNLAHPALADMKAWFDTHLPQDVRLKPLQI